MNRPTAENAALVTFLLFCLTGCLANNSTSVPQSIKIVAAKTANCNLVAEDGSICRLFPYDIQSAIRRMTRNDMESRCKHAASVMVGDQIMCAWRHE